MFCVRAAHSVEDTIKKSRFIGVIIPCQNEHDIIRSLKQLQDTHPNASHIAFAYRIKTDKGITARFNDAGEPSGTAGKPIFQHIEGKNLINVLIAVIRYFGGIKLGAGGLTRAYGNTAKKAVESAEIIDYTEHAIIRAKLDYSQLQHFDYQLKKLQGKILKQDFAERVELLVMLPAANVESLTTVMSDCQVVTD